LTILIVFISIISPLKGLGIFTSLFIFLGILIWGISLISLISGLKTKEYISKIRILMSIFFIAAFIPLGYLFMKISGRVKTKISVAILNHSDHKPANIKIYGVGNIFENTDTLKLEMLKKGESISYIIQASSKPHRSGYIKMEFDLKNKYISKNITGRFSVNPYEIKQEWSIVINNSFVE
jgi:energy-coupling factor transporter transmembrane protein EcfT